MINKCSQCSTEVEFNTNCKSCGWWYGLYKFTQTNEYKEEFGPNRKKK